MNFVLQKTKLFIPMGRERLVERPRLLERLDVLRDSGARVALISAPAGSGKTTLVVQWLKNLGWPISWLSLEAADNQPARFYAYLIAALQTVGPGVGDEALTLAEIPGATAEEVLAALINDLANVNGPFVLVLDDFHTIIHPALHQALVRLVERQPPQMRLVVLTREDPLLPLARLRARAELVEVRQEDLRFSPAEALDFLNAVMGLRLTLAQTERLEARTEGWIAGLQMAALSLQRAPDAEAFIRDFSGSHRFVLDYLIEEVLNQQSRQVQDFLLESAILERMCAPLCAALLGYTREQAAQMLETLVRANLFVVALDQERHWFRYHHLFRDLLIGRLQAGGAERIRVLSRRASDWFEANGDSRAALEYALRSDDMRHAARLFERHISERWQTVDLEFFQMVNRLPFAVLAESPTLCLHSAWFYLITAQMEKVEPLVTAAERCLNAVDREPDPDDAASRAFAGMMHTYLSDMQNQPVVLSDSLREVYEAIPEENTGMRNSAAIAIGTFHYMEGDLSGALVYFEDALRRDHIVNGTNAIPISTMRIVWVFQARGRLRQALDVVREQYDYIQAHGSRRYYISGVLPLMYGAILFEQNRLDEAESRFREGIHLMESWPIPPALCLGWSLMARLHVARGELTQACAMLEKVDELLRCSGLHPVFLRAIEWARLQVWIAEQDRTALEDWACQQANLADGEMRFRLEPQSIELCRIWLELGRKAEASALLARLNVAAGERAGSRIRILALYAVANSDQPRVALPALEQALRLAEPEGYRRCFLEAGQDLAGLLRLWLEDGVDRSDPALRAMVIDLLAAFENSLAPSTQNARLVEPLSKRELEVLHWVAEGLTNAQIAERLVISVRTVKKHIENLHGKLGVQNRTQAVARARELRIL
jgi:LuxR family maltose regulon positive regulatory protein